MQSVWKPAEWLHFYADSMPVLPYFRLCIGSLSLFMSCHSQPQDPILSGMTGGRLASMQPTSVWIHCRVFFNVLNRNNSIWWQICSTKQKQQCIFILTMVQIWPPGLQKTLHFQYGTPLTHFRDGLFTWSLWSKLLLDILGIERTNVGSLWLPRFQLVLWCFGACGLI